ncbi:MAG: C39 family peptidase [Candidatus Paceibacterota bacterium]|jgi:hypothetical protein
MLREGEQFDQTETGEFVEQKVEDIEPDAFSLSPESRQTLEDLKLKLQDFRDRFVSSDTQKIPFTEPGGEQDIARKMTALQKEKIPQIFKETDFESSHLAIHETQKEKNSCQLASVSNILGALGIEVSEKEIAGEIGKSGEFADIWPDQLVKYLRDKGLDVTRINDTLEAIDVLIRGGKIVLFLLPPKYPVAHAVAISGVKINHGKIEFYVNDPQYKNYAETLSLDDLVDIIIPYSFNRITLPYAVLKGRHYQNKSEK